MKKFLFVIFLLLYVVSLSFAEGTVVQVGSSYKSYNYGNMHVYTFTITSDAGSVPITSFVDFKKSTTYGMYLKSLEVYSATDDSFTVLLASELGSPLNGSGSATTTGTTGEIFPVTSILPMYSIPTIDVTGLATTEIATVIVVFVR